MSNQSPGRWDHIHSMSFRSASSPLHTDILLVQIRMVQHEGKRYCLTLKQDGGLESARPYPRLTKDRLVWTCRIRKRRHSGGGLRHGTAGHCSIPCSEDLRLRGWQRYRCSIRIVDREHLHSNLGYVSHVRLFSVNAHRYTSATRTPDAIRSY